MKPEKIKALATIAARKAIKNLGSDASIEDLENETLVQLEPHSLQPDELRMALDRAVRDIHHLKRTT